MDSAKLGLNDLLGGTAADLDHAFVVFFAKFRDSQDVLPGRYVAKHDAARTADASPSLVIDIDLGVYRCEDDETRQS